DREVADHRVEHAQVALGLLDDAGLGEVEPVQVDALALLGHLVGEPALAPVVDLDDLAAHALDHALDAGVDLGDALVGRVRAQDVDGLVFAGRARLVAQRRKSCHVGSSWAMGRRDVNPLATEGCASGGLYHAAVSGDESFGRPLCRFIAGPMPRAKTVSMSS